MESIFTPSEIEIIKTHYTQTPIAELLKLLPGKTKAQINGKAAKMSIKKAAKLVKGYKGVKKTAAQKASEKAKDKAKRELKKSREVKPEKSEKPKERSFKNRVVNPGDLVKIQVDHKTWLEIPKNKNIDEVVARYHDRQIRALKQLKK